MRKYRIKSYDIINDIWFIQKRVFLILWKWLGTGSKAEVTRKLKELEGE